MTQINSATRAGRVIRWWQRLAPLPLGPRMFSLALGWIAPYSGSIGARVETLRQGYARVVLDDRRRVRNHLKSVHAIALVNLGEIATGLAVLSAISTDMRGIVVNIHADYIKKARGRLTAIAEFELPATLEDNTACTVATEITDQTGDTVARVQATWLIGYKT